MVANDPVVRVRRGDRLLLGPWASSLPSLFFVGALAPAERFVWTAVSLTAISLVPPLLSGANTATTTALLGLHLVAATVMIPTLARSLRTRAIHDGSEASSC
jgi:hypothetical protein